MIASSTDPAKAAAGTPATGTGISDAARGGAQNLVGAVVYGASNFVLLILLTRMLGVEASGAVLVAIAIFNIISKVCELGCSTGLIRWISRRRAQKQEYLLQITLVVAIVPVVIGGVLAAVALFLLAPALASVFASGDQVDSVSDLVRSMAPFLPISALYSVVIQGTRGFNTMVPNLIIEKVGRATLLLVLVWAALAMDLGAQGAVVFWASSNVIAIVPAILIMIRLEQRAIDEGRRLGHAPPPGPAASRREIGISFWRYAGPRAAGQLSEIMISWLDTVLVGALISTSAAGIYGAGTRLMLPGLFVGEAVMQVVGPKVSAMLIRSEVRDAGVLVRTATGWQALILWPIYLLVLGYAPTMLKVFGPEVVEATGALRALAVAVLIAALMGPAVSVVLMSGRSRQAMFNTFVALVINIVGNVVFLPRYGITAAGVVWAVTMVVMAVLPTWQADRSLHVRTYGAPGFLAAGAAVVSVGLATAASLVIFGQRLSGLAVATVVGGIVYLLILRSMDDRLHLSELVRSLVPGRVLHRGRPSTADTRR